MASGMSNGCGKADAVNSRTFHNHDVFGIEPRQTNDQNGLVPDGAVSHAGRNEHAETRLHRQKIVVQLHLRTRLAIEHIIGFREAAVVVEFRIARNLRTMQRSGELGYVGQGPAGDAACAFLPRQTVKVNNPVSLLFRRHRLLHVLQGMNEPYENHPNLA